MALSPHTGRGKGSKGEQWVLPALLPGREPHLLPSLWQLSVPLQVPGARPLVPRAVSTQRWCPEQAGPSPWNSAHRQGPFRRSLQLPVAACCCSLCPTQLLERGSLVSLPPPTCCCCRSISSLSRCSAVCSLDSRELSLLSVPCCCHSFDLFVRRMNRASTYTAFPHCRELDLFTCLGPWKHEDWHYFQRCPTSQGKQRQRQTWPSTLPGSW